MLVIHTHTRIAVRTHLSFHIQVIIMSNAKATAIKQWFCLCDQHSRTRRRRNNEKKACQTDVNMDYSFHWSLCEGNRQKHSHLIAADLEVVVCVCAAATLHTLTGSTISVRCECACSIEGFPVFFSLFRFSAKRWLYVLLMLNISRYKLQYRYIRWRARQTYIVFARTELVLKQLSCIFIFIVNTCL